MRRRNSDGTLGAGLPTFNMPLLNSLQGSQFGTTDATFTRATTKTVTDFEGLIRTVKSGEAAFTGARRVENLIVASEDMTNGAYSAVNGAVIDSATQATFDGTSDGRITQTLTVGDDNSGAGGRLWRFSVSVRVVSGTIGAASQVRLGQTGGAATAEFQNIGGSVSDTAQRFSMLFTSDAAGTTLIALVECDVAAVLEITDWQVEEVTGQANQNPSEYVSTGVLSSPYHGANVDGVRWFTYENGNTVSSGVVTEAQGDAIAASTLKGVSIEGARTNVILQSNAFTTTWTDLNATPAANYAIAPDGTKTAWRLVDDGSTGTGSVYFSQGLTITTNVDYVWSAYVKADQLSWVALSPALYDESHGTYFDLDSGVIGSQGASHSDAGIESVGDGWYRVWAVYQSTTDVAGFFRIFASDGDGDITVDLDGTSSILVWGAQVEAGSFPSSYIATTTTAVTRNADVLTYSAVGNADSFPMTVSVDYTMGLNSGVNQLIVEVSDNSSSDRAVVFVNATIFPEVFMNRNGGTQASFAGADSLNSGVTYAIAAVFGTDDVELYLDGQTTGTPDTSALLPIGVVDINIGSRYDEANQPFGNIKNVRIYNKRLSDSQVAGL